MSNKHSVEIERQQSDAVKVKDPIVDYEKGKDTSVTYVDGFKEEDRLSIESETQEYVLKQPPDGGRAWLVLFGCFCVCSYIIPENGNINSIFLKTGSLLHVRRIS